MPLEAKFLADIVGDRKGSVIWPIPNLKPGDENARRYIKRWIDSF